MQSKSVQFHQQTEFTDMLSGERLTNFRINAFQGTIHDLLRAMAKESSRE